MTSAREREIARSVERIAAAEVEDLIAARIPPGSIFIHVRKPALYGSVASISYGNNAYLQPGITSHPKGPVSWARAVELVEALPPVAMVYVRGNAHFHAPLGHDGLSESEREHAQVTDPAPVRLELGGTPRDHGACTPWVRCRWFTLLEGVGTANSFELVEIEVDLGTPPAGVLTYTARRIDYRGGSRYEPAHVDIRADINARDPNDAKITISLVEQPIVRWSAREAPGVVEIIQHHLGTKRPPAIWGAAIVKRIAGLVDGSVTGDDS